MVNGLPHTKQNEFVDNSVVVAPQDIQVAVEKRTVGCDYCFLRCPLLSKSSSRVIIYIFFCVKFVYFGIFYCKCCVCMC